MRKLLLPTLICMFLISCSKDDGKDNNPNTPQDQNSNTPVDVNCSNAQVEVCNNTSKKAVYYGWNSGQIEDTLFPGECEILDLGKLILKYGDNGNLIEEVRSTGTFHTGSSSKYIEANKCFESINAPGGYVDIAHCYNGVFDADEGEYGVDCGGTCPPCENITVPCAATLKDGIMQVENSNDIPQSRSFASTPGGKMQIRVNFYSGQILDVTLNIKSFPTATRTFVTGSDWSDAKIEYNDGRFDYTVKDGSTLYVSPISSGAKLEFCDWEFTGLYSSFVASASLEVE